MRQPKYRGKRKDNGEWVYGYYFIEERDIEDGIIWRDIPQIQQRYGDHYQYFAVIPETVGEFTGLLDKNGKEIYEGDILEDTLGWVYEVRWDNNGSRFLGYHSKPRGDTYICYIGRDPKSEIIGNIWEVDS